MIREQACPNEAVSPGLTFSLHLQCFALPSNFCYLLAVIRAAAFIAGGGTKTSLWPVLFKAIASDGQ
jgi:hypothetical protein